jgi:hypothetical protein
MGQLHRTPDIVPNPNSRSPICLRLPRVRAVSDTEGA